MGGAVAANMKKAGFEVVGYDPSTAAQEAAKEAGIPVFDSPAEAAREADYVCSSVPKGEHVRDAYLGEKGALLTAKEGHLAITTFC